MNLDGLTNITFQPETPAIRGSNQEPGAPPAEPFRGRVRSVTASPVEEWSARCAAHGQPEKVPDALAAILLANRKRVKVGKNGVDFQIAGETFRYWSADSHTCHPSNAGRDVNVIYKQDLKDAIFVLDDHGRYIETIPLYKAPAWFTAEARRVQREFKRVLNQTVDHLERTHGKTMKEATDRAEANLRTLATHTLPPPESGREKHTEAPTAGGRSSRTPGRSISRAKEIQDAVLAVERNRDHAARVVSDSRRRRAEAGTDFDDLIGAGGRPRVEREEREEAVYDVILDDLV